MTETRNLKHQAIERGLRRLIDSGRLKPGQKLPSELALAQEHRVSAGTVRRALSTLVQEGVLEPRRGSGVYVREKKRRKIVGAMVPNLRDPSHVGLVQAVTQAATERGYATALFCLEDPPKKPLTGIQRQMPFLERMGEFRATGIICAPTNILDEPRMRARMRELDIPHVVVDDFWNDCRGHHHLCVDLDAAVEMAVEHLVNLGHRRLALWRREKQYDEWTGPGRVFREMFAEQGGDGFEASVCMETSADFADHLSVGGPRTPTAVVVPYYHRACELVEAFRARGIEVPRDISVVCLGGPANAREDAIGLTATVNPMNAIAEQALDILVKRQQDPICHLLYKPTLRVGATTAPCGEADPRVVAETAEG